MQGSDKMALPKLDVNPDVLKWARHESGRTINDVAARLKKDASVVQEWESTGAQIPLTKLEGMAKCYKRQLAALFLPEPPQVVKRPKDRRQTGNQPLGHTSMLAIRRTSRYLAIARELENHQSRYTWLNNIEVTLSKVEESANRFRELVENFLPDERLIGRDFRYWRDFLQYRLGIYVFNLPIATEDGLDGFSYIEEGIPYGITVNSKTTLTRRLFTLFHEVGHILHKQSGLCKTGLDSNQQNTIEVWCNRFAAEFLMPASQMSRIDSYDDLSAKSGSLKVSREAYLYRLKGLGMIGSQDLNDYLNKVKDFWAKEQEERNKNKKEMKIPPEKLSRGRRGGLFFDLVIEAYSDNRLTASEASDILQIKPTRL